MNYRNENTKVITVKEFSKKYNIGLNKSYELVNAEDFPKIRCGRKIIIVASKIDEWIENKIGNTF